MSKRKYTHVKELESIIISLREAGLTRQKIADELGLTKAQIKSWTNVSFAVFGTVTNFCGFFWDTSVSPFRIMYKSRTP